MSYDWISNSSHFGGGGNCIRRLLHLAFRTWVLGHGSLVADGHGLCGRFRHRKSSQNVIGRTDGRNKWLYHSTIENRCGMSLDGRTDATSDFIYTSGYPVHNAPCWSPHLVLRISHFGSKGWWTLLGIEISCTPSIPPPGPSCPSSEKKMN
jgi:hypothetical protein